MNETIRLLYITICCLATNIGIPQSQHTNGFGVVLVEIGGVDLTIVTLVLIFVIMLSARFYDTDI